MKRRDLVKLINLIASDKNLEAVWTEGGSHSKVALGHVTIAVPRHAEINEDTAKAILRQARKA